MLKFLPLEAGLLAALVLAAFLLAACPVPTATAQDTLLPFAGTDTVTVHRHGERVQTLPGRIEDISGETLTLRRSGQTGIQVLKISDVTALTFARSTDFEDGLKYQQQKQYREALRHFDKAITGEDRIWAQNELQAAAAKVCIAMGNRDGAVDRIELILKVDARSRHASLLPLVWDAELPAAERVSADPGDLRSESEARQLVAASALLGSESHHPAAVRQLRQIRQQSAHRLSELAEAQLWRLPLLSGDGDEVTSLNVWQQHVRRMPLQARGGPQFVIARCLQQQHDYDNASLAFLWMPFMAPTDKALSALSMLESIRCLQMSGRTQEAAALKRELLQRFPKTSAAETLRNEAATGRAVPE